MSDGANETDGFKRLASQPLQSLLRAASSLAFVGKGSGGKSTLAVFIAVIAASCGHRVLILDADVQNRSVVDWLRLRHATRDRLRQRHRRTLEPVRIDVAILRASTETIVPFTISDAEEPVLYDLVIMDFAGNPSAERAAWARHADRVLLPTETSVAALCATERIVSHCRNIGVEPTLVFNRARPGHRLTEASIAARDIGVEVGPSIRQYIQHQDAFARGVGISEYPGSGEAHKDVERLWCWYKESIRRPDDAADSLAPIRRQAS